MNSNFVYYFTWSRNSSIDYKVPAVYIGEFTTQESSFDSFLKMDKFTKVIILILNGIINQYNIISIDLYIFKGIALVRSNDTLTNLGRYWPNTGPQVTLYTPGAFITPRSTNSIVLVEFEGSSCQSNSDCIVEFIDYPIIDSL